MITSTQIIDAIQARLVGDVGITAIVPAASIGNFLPQDNAYPHIFYSTSFEVSNIKEETAQEVTLQIDVYSKDTSSNEVLRVMDAVQNGLDGVPITIASGDCFATYYLTGTTELDSDGKTYQGTAIYILKYGDS